MPLTLGLAANPLTPEEVDRHIGQRLSQRREEKNLTMAQLGIGVGVSFQQIQKYESGKNRISASTLYAVCMVTKTRMDYFFEGLPDPLLTHQSNGRKKSKERLRLEKLAVSPVGSQTTFTFGSFQSVKSAQAMINAIGEAGWATISTNSRGTVVKKVREP